jgi:N4-gp56 family major capsid protein
MRPVMINGQKYFHCFLTPEQEYDLRQDSAWKTAQQNAAERGGDNPLFTGALGIWNGLVLRTLDCGVLFNDYGAGANVGAARALILGAQAGAIAFGGVGGTTDGGGRWKYTEKQFDYDNQVGFAVKTIVGAKKLNFNGKDFGAFSVDTAYTA